jgi:hypothetical protein
MKTISFFHNLYQLQAFNKFGCLGVDECGEWLHRHHKPKKYTRNSFHL